MWSLNVADRQPHGSGESLRERKGPRVRESVLGNEVERGEETVHHPE